MKFPRDVKDWAPYYQALHDAGHSDTAIGGFAGVDRVVVNAVRNGKYKSDHQPAYSGAIAVLAKVAEAVANGKLKKTRLQPLGIEL